MEHMKIMKVCIGVPSRGLIHASWIQHLLKVIKCTPTYVKLKFLWFYDYTADVRTAREFLVDKALKYAVDYFFFLDDDVYPPKDVLELLLSARKNVISGVYWTKGVPSFPVYSTKGEKHVTNFNPPNKVFEIVATGLGCFLISMDVLAKIPKPRFPFLYPLEMDGAFLAGEDYAFCYKVREIAPIWCHSQVLCDHFSAYDQKWFPPNEVCQSLVGRRRFSFGD